MSERLSLIPTVARPPLA